MCITNNHAARSEVLASMVEGPTCTLDILLYTWTAYFSDCLKKKKKKRSGPPPSPHVTNTIHATTSPPCEEITERTTKKFHRAHD